MATIRKYYTHLLVIFLFLFTSIECYAGSWYDPMKIPPDCSQQELENIMHFNNELANAKTCYQNEDFYGMTNSIEKALTYRPNDPENIRLEYKMAVAMSQYRKQGEERPQRLDEALKLYQRVLDDYSHMDYYSRNPQDSDSIESPQMMMPRAAIHVSSIMRGLSGDYIGSREYAEKAMDYLNQTFKKRKADWLESPKPQQGAYDHLFDPPSSLFRDNLSPYDRKVKNWEENIRKAKEGDIFGKHEIATTMAAVSEYGYSFGEKQDIGDVILAMNNIIEKYPDTPMSKIALQYIDHAKNKVLSELDKDIMDNVFEAHPIDENIITSAGDFLDVSIVKKDKAIYSIPEKIVADQDSNSNNFIYFATAGLVSFGIVGFFIGRHYLHKTKA